MPREKSFHCKCWEIDIRPDDVEDILARLREQNPGVIIQIFGASRRPNAATVEMIAAQTVTATRSGPTLAERPELDLLLRLAGTRQIAEAFTRMGYRSDGKRLFMVAASRGNAAPLERLGKQVSRDRRFTEVSRKRLGRNDLEIIERAALLAARL